MALFRVLTNLNRLEKQSGSRILEGIGFVISKKIFIMRLLGRFLLNIERLGRY